MGIYLMAILILQRSIHLLGFLMVRPTIDFFSINVFRGEVHVDKNQLLISNLVRICKDIYSRNQYHHLLKMGDVFCKDKLLFVILLVDSSWDIWTHLVDLICFLVNVKSIVLHPALIFNQYLCLTLDQFIWQLCELIQYIWLNLSL